MKKIQTNALLCFLMIGILILCSQASAVYALDHESSLIKLSSGSLTQNNDPQKKVSCEEALKHVFEIKVGMRDSQVLDLLGEPTGKLENEWGYNFMACAMRPKVGEQKVIGLGITFNEGVVKKIGYSTIDAIGPAPSSKPVMKKGKKRFSKPAKRVRATMKAKNIF